MKPGRESYIEEVNQRLGRAVNQRLGRAADEFSDLRWRTLRLDVEWALRVIEGNPMNQEELEGGVRKIYLELGDALDRVEHGGEDVISMPLYVSRILTWFLEQIRRNTVDGETENE